MAVQIEAFRLSLIWGETNLALIRPKDAPTAPMQFLARKYWYEPKFKEAQKKKGAPPKDAVATDLRTPWPGPSGQRFWTSYLGGTQPGDVSCETAWSLGVPLRGRVPAWVSADWWPGRLGLEAFYYSHGVSLVLTGTCEGQNLSIDEFVTLASRLRRGGKLHVQWAGGVVEDLTASAFASQALVSLRQAMLGPGGPPGKPLGLDPFTIVTVLRGSADSLDSADPSQPEIHRALEAVCSWSTNWSSDPLSELSLMRSDKTKVPSDQKSVYGRARGRAIWFPTLFTQSSPEISSLSCYHRNLVFASLQVENLAGFVSATADLIDLDGGTSIESLAHRFRATSAAETLMKLYTGDPTVYRSRSTMVQMDDNAYTTHVARVLKHFGKGHLV